MNQTPLDWDNNFKNIHVACEQARDKNIDIICFPELCLSGYNCEDMFHAPWVIEKSNEYLDKARALSQKLTLILGCAIPFQNKLYNCAVVLRDATIIGIAPKQHLANRDIYYEYRWFNAWDDHTTTITINGQEIPFGRIIFSQNNFNFGIEICEDAWQENRPAAQFIKDDIDVIFNLSASHFSLHKIDQRLALAQKLIEKKPTLTYAYTNILGNEAGRAIYDGSSYICSAKETILAPRFSFKNCELISQVLTKTESPKDSLTHHHRHIVVSAINETTIPTRGEGDRRCPLDAQGVPRSIRELHEFTLAVSLGIYDYLRKSGNQRIVISLSGGADSAACAILSHLAYTFAIKQRGKTQVAYDLRLSRKDVENHDFLYCIYQKSVNNSEKTLEIAKCIASNIQANFFDVEIDESVQTYLKNGEQILATRLNWKEHDISLQNIQARVRGPLVWLIANIKNALLLATSNRSEAAVGYATMDGDTCGGLSPIAGVDKSFLLRWLRWLEKDKTYGDFTFLEALNSLEPTAELKPLSENQKDEDDLMPYSILNEIEHLFLYKKLSPEQIILELVSNHPVETSEVITEWVHRFLDRWRKNQWKRERYAPSFQLDEYSVDPKTWCRYPILSGKLY